MSKTPFTPAVLKHVFFAFFNFIVTNILAADFFVTITFYMPRPRPFGDLKIWTFIYTKTDIATFGDIKQPRIDISKDNSLHFLFYRLNYRQVINITCPNSPFTHATSVTILRHENSTI